MPNYLCIRRSGSTENCEPPSPSQMEELYAAFAAWKEQFRANIVDMGGKLGGGKVLTSETETDGPFVESKEIVGGFMVLAAESLDAAVAIARASPGILGPGASLEVREIHTP